MKQLTKELKSVLTTGYNLTHRTGEETYFYIQYWFSCHWYDKPRTYCWIIRDGDRLLAKIKYGDKNDKNNYERYTDDKNTKNLIKRAWKRYA